MQQTTDPRLREIMTSLVSHLHAFVRDVRLTEEEFQSAAATLNEMGQATTETHNETVLMAGSLGVSTLVCLLNNGDDGATETQQNLLGPFWRMHSPRTANGASIVRSPDARARPSSSARGCRTRTAIRSPGPRSMCGIPRRSGSTSSRTPGRRR